MGTDNLIFLEVLEWFDLTGSEAAHRIPPEGSGEIKFGAQCIVRDSQAAVFYSGGVACDALGPGRHTLTSLNVPLLTKLLALPWGMKSPFRAEVYFVNLKTFAGLKWGTRDPVAFRDRELGLVRLRAHGIFNVQVVQPVLFVNSLVGTQASYRVEALEQYVSDVIVSRLNDHLGEHLDTLAALPSRYEELAAGLAKRLEADLSRFGLALRELYINAITPPAEVGKTIDDRSRLSLVGDQLQDLMRLKMATAIEAAGQGVGEASGGGAAGGGFGMGMGLLLPGLLTGMADTVPHAKTLVEATVHCPECAGSAPADARFCPNCGSQLLVLRKCGRCGHNIKPQARFCSACGAPADAALGPRRCACGAENRPEAVYCNQCGEALGGKP